MGPDDEISRFLNFLLPLHPYINMNIETSFMNFYLFLFELSGQTISRKFIEQALICPLDSIGRH